MTHRIRDEPSEEAGHMAPRFMQLDQVAEVLDISHSQTYALVRSGELPAIKVGGRGQWRVEIVKLDDYIARAYTETRAFLEEHPYLAPPSDGPNGDRN